MAGTNDKPKETMKPKLSDAEAIKWLADYFKRNQTVLCDVVREEAAAVGINRRQLKMARKALHIRTWHQFDEGGATPNWFWTVT